MGFFDKARAGYEDLAGRADGVLDSATAGRALGEIDQHYRDLGMLTYLAATGRGGDSSVQERLVATLGSMEQRGAIRDFVLQTGGQPTGGAPGPSGEVAVPVPPPERAGRHGDFLQQQRLPADGPGEPGGRRQPEVAPPSIGGTWGPASQDETGPRRWRPVRSEDE